LAVKSSENDADRSRPVIDYYSYQPRPVDIGTEGILFAVS